MNKTYECERTLLVQAEFDGELDAAQAAELAPHREQCVHCQAVQEQLVRSRTLLRAAPRYEAPAKLREGILGRLREMQSERGREGLERAHGLEGARGRASVQGRDASASAASPREGQGERLGGTHSAPASRFGSAWRMGAGWGAALAATLVAAVFVLRTPESPDVGMQLVSNHLRAMQLDSHLIDVVSTDHHTVKPWFAGKVDFAPPVKQLDADGYVLKGGRIDIVDASTAAVLVYQAGRHLVDVYIWPTREADSARFRDKQITGFNLRHWQEGGLTVWCVSDMGAAELDRFAERWRTKG